MVYIGPNARVFNDARVSDGAWVFDNARVFNDARVSGDAWVSEQKHIAWQKFEARSGVYTLTLYM